MPRRSRNSKMRGRSGDVMSKSFRADAGATVTRRVTVSFLEGPSAATYFNTGISSDGSALSGGKSVGNSSEWAGLAAVWQEFRVKSMELRCLGPVAATGAPSPAAMIVFYEDLGNVLSYTTVTTSSEAISLSKKANIHFVPFGVTVPSIARARMAQSDFQNQVWQPTNIGTEVTSDCSTLWCYVGLSGISSSMQWQFVGIWDVELRGLSSSSLSLRALKQRDPVDEDEEDITVTVKASNATRLLALNGGRKPTGPQK